MEVVLEISLVIWTEVDYLALLLDSLWADPLVACWMEFVLEIL